MQSRINQLQRTSNFKEGLRNTCRANKISVTVLNGLTIKRLRAIQNRTTQHYESNPEKARGSWFQNELRLFHWILLIESFFLNQLLNQFDLQHWTHLQTYFPTKSPNMFEFEAKKLLGNNSPNYSRNWHQEECLLLSRIMEDKFLINRWNEVARRFYELSDKKFYRSSKQCREQWFNHLDHSKIHGQWAPTQDKAILQFVLKEGRKWAQMCKELLPHRTQHMIKNRFKSLLVKGELQWKRDGMNERRLIKKLLGKGTLQEQPDPQQFQIKQKPTFYSEKEIREHEGSDSFLRDQSEEVSNSLGQRSNFVNQIIKAEQKEDKQNKRLGRKEPLKPIPLQQHHLTLISQTANPSYPFNPILHPQTISQHPNTAFTFLPIYPSFFTFLNATRASPSSSQFQELNVEAE